MTKSLTGGSAPTDGLVAYLALEGDLSDGSGNAVETTPIGEGTWVAGVADIGSGYNGMARTSALPDMTS